MAQTGQREGYAIGAFNVGNLETLRVAAAAGVARSPALVESSSRETAWIGARNLVDLVRNYAQQYDTPMILNLDHALTFEACETAVEAGYGLIHFDGSALPLDENAAITRSVAELAHSNGRIGEGELDHIAGTSEVHAQAIAGDLPSVKLTEPQQARWFVAQTGIDVFAASVSHVHGLYEGQARHVDAGLVRRIAVETGVLLSLHGSSGLPGEDVQAAVASGVVKVKLNTEMRREFWVKLQGALAAQPDEYVPYRSEAPVVDALERLVTEKIQLLGSAGKAA